MKRDHVASKSSMATLTKSYGRKLSLDVALLIYQFLYKFWILNETFLNKVRLSKLNENFPSLINFVFNY